jgi:hypothetical protein
MPANRPQRQVYAGMHKTYSGTANGTRAACDGDACGGGGPSEADIDATVEARIEVAKASLGRNDGVGIA